MRAAYPTSSNFHFLISLLSTKKCRKTVTNKQNTHNNYMNNYKPFNYKIQAPFITVV
jgi:hypothetical protein